MKGRIKVLKKVGDEHGMEGKAKAEAVGRMREFLFFFFRRPNFCMVSQGACANQLPGMVTASRNGIGDSRPIAAEMWGSLVALFITSLSLLCVFAIFTIFATFRFNLASQPRASLLSAGSSWCELICMVSNWPARENSDPPGYRTKVPILGLWYGGAYNTG